MRLAAAVLLVAAVALVSARPRVAGQRQMRATVETQAPSRAEVVRSTDALPAHIGAAFLDPVAFIQFTSGQYLVLDRRAQAVYSIDRAKTAMTRIVQVGEEPGRIIRPTAFASDPRGSFVVVDQPGPATRIQRFADRGYLLNGFTLAPRSGPQISVPGFVSGTIDSVQYTGDAIVVSEPSSGSLMTEYAWNGAVRRAFGAFRPTGQESDRAVHAALNAGIPLIDPTGGFYFVFRAGIPAFRKYDADGRLVFERHIEGRELDDTLRDQPNAWPKRPTGRGGEWPAVPLLVRTAAVDPCGNLWIALVDRVVYVYSPDGDKIRTLQLRAAGPLAPVSLFFSSASRLLVAPGCYIFDTTDLLR